MEDASFSSSGGIVQPWEEGVFFVGDSDLPRDRKMARYKKRLQGPIEIGYSTPTRRKPL
jgi:hypothetical protein